MRELPSSNLLTSCREVLSKIYHTALKEITILTIPMMKDLKRWYHTTKLSTIYLLTHAGGSTIFQPMQLPPAWGSAKTQPQIAFKHVIFVKTSRCENVCWQCWRIHLFLHVLNENIRNQARHCYAEHPKTTLDSLGRYVNEIDRKSDGSLYQKEDRRKSKKGKD